jgi:CRP-like cAMP-binding protein
MPHFKTRRGKIQAIRKRRFVYKITVPFSQEEIGEIIGTSRESVTRAFTELRNFHLISLKGSALTVSNRAALEAFAGN